MRLRAMRGDVVVALMSPARDGAHQIAPSGLAYGREVAIPFGRVVAVGAAAAQWLHVGQVVCLVRDDGAALEWRSMAVQRVTVVCPSCGRLSAAQPVLAVVDGRAMREAPGRILVRPDVTVDTRLVVPEDDGYLRTDERPVREGTRVETGERVVYRERAGHTVRWDGAVLTSLRTDEGCPGHPEQEAAELRRMGLPTQTDRRGWRPRAGEVLATASYDEAPTCGASATPHPPVSP